VVLVQSQQASVSPGLVVQVGAIMVGSLGVDSLHGDASVHAIMEQLMRGCSKQVRPMDVRSGWADRGRINGSGLRTT
jgi:hypothetical protein